MKAFRNKLSFTIVELLIVVALIAVLASIMMMVAGQGNTASDTELTKSTLALLDSALQEYHDYTGKFPLPDLIGETYFDPNYPGQQIRQHNASLYIQLSLVEESRSILEKIPESQINPKDFEGSVTVQFIDPFGQSHTQSSYLEILDGWKMPLDYIYVSEPSAKRMNFPSIISAGPDKNFGTTDDITNKK